MAQAAQYQLVEEQFVKYFSEVQELRSTASEALKTVVKERNGDSETEAWVQHSLDVATVFRFLKKHKFSSTAALNALILNCKWRIDTLPYLPPPRPTLLLRFSPAEAKDPFSRPILVVRARHLSGFNSEEVKSIVLNTYELARLHIADLFKGGEASGIHVLQFVVIIDLEGLAIRDMPMDLVPWFGKVVIPQFPGMCGACYVVNYSWAYSGMWNVLKRLLPTRALSRVFFPSQSELLTYLPPTSLSKEHGGELSSPRAKHDPLLRKYLPNQSDLSSTVSSDSASSVSSSRPPSPTPPTSIGSRTPPETSSDLKPSSPSQLYHPHHHRSHKIKVAPTSSFNTYFGYPTVLLGTGPNEVPHLRHGRRRTRDLIRTLAFLFLRRVILGVKRILLGPFYHSFTSTSSSIASPFSSSYSRTATSAALIRAGTSVSSGLRKSRWRRRWGLWVWWSVIVWLLGSAGRLLSEGLDLRLKVIQALVNIGASSSISTTRLLEEVIEPLKDLLLTLASWSAGGLIQNAPIAF